jgi:hypothetical protein
MYIFTHTHELELGIWPHNQILKNTMMLKSDILQSYIAINIIFQRSLISKSATVQRIDFL